MKSLPFWLPAALLCALGLFLRFGLVGYSFSALVCFFLAGLLVCAWALNRLVKKFGPKLRWLRTSFYCCLAVGFAVVAVTEGFILHASLGDPEESCDYIVVLGCMVRPDGPSVSLQNRIDAAYDYLTEHPEVIAVVSGGQGPDEPMTEAKCMYDALVEKGIDPERIWIEDKATSTWANLEFSLELIEARTGTRPARLGILSSEYHLFRASLLARDLGVEAVGIPAKTTLLPQAVNHFMREVAGVWHYILLGGQYD